MKIVKIKFVDFWEHWNQEDNFIVNTLKKYFKVEFSENPDYVFYSNFSKRLDHMKYKNAVKIFYTQENLCPDFNFADYGIGFEELTYGDRYLQFPICYIDERYGDAWRKMKIKHMDVQGNAEKYINREFCGMVVSNKDADSIRDEFFEKLSQYRFVSSGGRYRNNIGQPKGVIDKLEFLEKHKFSLCFENSSHPGYYTEKLIEGFAAKTVPIYWGDPHIEQIFNPNAFINLSNCKTVDEMIEKVKTVELDEKKYVSMLLEPALNEKYNTIWENKQQELENFLLHIFSEEKEKTYRRNRVFWGERYCNQYKKMRNFYVFFFQNKFEVALIKKIKKLKKECVGMLSR